jgi:phosphatidylserine/phosphatidylglycerophosphate/cardiolipin synthase-like enzyme
MIKFLNQNRLIKELENIFSEADEFIYVVSPYVKLDSWLRRNIKNCAAEEFVLVYGKTDMERRSYNFVNDFEDIDLYFHQDLHAKVYINEHAALVASMNLYDYSIENNIECGVLIPSNESSYAYALEFVEDIIDDAELEYKSKKRKAFKKSK